mmetsp:Transcript_2844/g.4355  ORF Transcript_2844/g.4355 Transcript_2844/m.4355 type:complete len:580 (-) Transcript_2844:159-1898(-)
MKILASAVLIVSLQLIAAFRILPKVALHRKISVLPDRCYRRASPSSLLATIAETSVADEEDLGMTVNPRRFRKATKQLATLGPASNSLQMIEKLFLSGADVFRLNFSHGEHAEKAELVKMIRTIEEKYNHPIAILGDLQGPKLRVGTFENDFVMLEDGAVFSFDLKDVLGNEERVQLPHPEILNTLRTGDTLLLDDGKLRMEVIETTMADVGGESDHGYVKCKVINGGKLSNKKGVNTPSIVLPISPLTPKDRRDLEFILTLDIDWVALSFVQKPGDMAEFRSLAGDGIKLMAKLEKPSAINYLDEIVDLSDGIMVARGDLGVEMNPWDVPVLQKRIVETCKLLGKPVVIATQMMESMIDNPTPTRAEASDCATAIYDSTDAVMLSAESAAGKFPVESVLMQQQVINKVETDDAFRISLDRFAQEFDMMSGGDSTTTAITLAARQVATISGSKAIVAFSASGGTPVRMAKLRPQVPILAVCEDIKIARWLALVWGVYPIMMPPHVGDFNIKFEIDKACKLITDMGFADPETDVMTVTAGLPWGSPGTTNIIRVTSAKGTGYWFGADGKATSFAKQNFDI